MLGPYTFAWAGAWAVKVREDGRGQRTRPDRHRSQRGQFRAARPNPQSKPNLPDFSGPYGHVDWQDGGNK